jgi:hypothetical protein
LEIRRVLAEIVPQGGKSGGFGSAPMPLRNPQLGERPLEGALRDRASLRHSVVGGRSVWLVSQYPYRQ